MQDSKNKITTSNHKYLDIIVLISIFLLALILIINFAKIPIAGDDAWFHLVTAKQTLENKSLPLTDTWSFQPSIRPNVYSPVYHLVLAGVASISKLSAISNQLLVIMGSSQILSTIFYPTTLFGIWFLARKMISPKTAFFAFFISLFDIILANPHFELTPSSLFLAIMPFTVYFFYKKNFLVTLLLIILALYTHMTAPLCLLFGFAIYSLNFKKEYWKFCKKVLIFSLIGFSPWIIWTFYNLKFFNGYNYIFRIMNYGISSVAFFSAHTISLVIFIMSIGTFIFLGYIIRHKQNMFMLMAMPIAFLPVLFGAGGRYWWYVEPFLVILFGYLMAWKIKNIKPVFAVVLIGITIIFYLPAVTIDFTNKGNIVDWQKSQAGFAKAIQISKQSKDQNPLPDDLIQFIKSDTSSDEIISVSGGKLAMQITFFTDRKTNSGMFGEVLTKEAFENQFDPFANRIIVCEKQKCPSEPMCELRHYEIKDFDTYEVWVKK